MAGLKLRRRVAMESNWKMDVFFMLKFEKE